MIKRPAQSGFSLVELSIVLVILGLLTGGILAGQSLIRASELRAATSEFSRYRAAVLTFRDKYFASPGDMPNAVKFWQAQAGGTANGVDATCAALTAPATGAPTCNGDGDGTIGNTPFGEYYEWYRAWQHLANAGLVEGNYAGVSIGINQYTSVIGRNIPKSRLSNAGWTMRGLWPYYAGDANFFAGNYNTMLMFGAPVANDWNNGPVLKAEEAWNIDTKLDDGLPHLGNVRGYKNAFQSNCVVATNDAYALSNTSIGCSVMFLNII